MENDFKRAPISDDELGLWAKLRADDAGHIARELVNVRQLMRELVQSNQEEKGNGEIFWLMSVKIKPLEWKEDWGGSLDDIPEWRAETPFGRVTVSVAGMVDGEGHRYERHSDVPEKHRVELQRKAETHYQMKIKRAINLTIEVKPLSWSDPKKPCEECRYDHVRSETSIGNYQIEWKGWKDYPGYALYFGGNYIDSFDGLIEAKDAAFEHAKNCVKGMIE